VSRRTIQTMSDDLQPVPQKKPTKTWALILRFAFGIELRCSRFDRRSRLSYRDAKLHTYD
jgi:hypothetical protein